MLVLSVMGTCSHPCASRTRRYSISIWSDSPPSTRSAIEAPLPNRQKVAGLPDFSWRRRLHICGVGFRVLKPGRQARRRPDGTPAKGQCRVAGQSTRVGVRRSESEDDGARQPEPLAEARKSIEAERGTEVLLLRPHPPPTFMVVLGLGRGLSLPVLEDPPALNP